MLITNLYLLVSPHLPVLIISFPIDHITSFLILILKILFLCFIIKLYEIMNPIFHFEFFLLYKKPLF